MSEMVKLVIKSGEVIKFTIMSTGERSTVVNSSKRIQLLRDRMYYVPVDTKENLDNNTIFKVPGQLNELIDVRNIENGIACIVPIVHKTVIENEQVVGVFI